MALYVREYISIKTNFLIRWKSFKTASSILKHSNFYSFNILQL